MEDVREGPRGSDTRHLVEAGAIVSGLGLVNKLLGLVRGPAEAAIFGADRAMDALNIARQIPQAFSTWIEGPIRAAVVPIFTRRLHEEGEEAAWSAASNILNTLAVALVLFSAALALLAGPIVRLLGFGFEEPEAWRLGTRLGQIMAVSVAFSVLAVIIGSLQNVYRRQIFPALGRVANAAMLLAAVLVLAPRMGQEGYAWGFLAGAIAALLLQLGLLWNKRRYYRLTLRPWAPEIRELVVVALPLFLGLMGTRIDTFLDFFFASFLPEGHLSVRVYGELLALQATDLMLMISQAVLLPHFAHLVAQGRHQELKRRLLQATGGYLVLLLPVTALLCAGSRSLVDLFFLRGAFTVENAELAAVVVPIIALGAPPYLIGQLYAQAHISAGETKKPMWIGFARVGVKLALSLSLIVPLGIVGLVLASTLSSYLRTYLLWRWLPVSYRPPGRRICGLAARLIVAGGLAALAVWGVLEVIAPPQRLGIAGEAGRLAVAGAAGAGVHMLAAWLLGDATIRDVLRRVSARVRRRS